MGVRRSKAPQVFPCIDCGGRGTVPISRAEADLLRPLDPESDTLEIVCDRCEGAGIEATG